MKFPVILERYSSDRRRQNILEVTKGRRVVSCVGARPSHRRRYRSGGCALNARRTAIAARLFRSSEVSIAAKLGVNEDKGEGEACIRGCCTAYYDSDGDRTTQRVPGQS